MGFKELRQRRGLTQQDVAERMKTTQQTIARWESGKTAIPTAYLPKLASLLGGVPIEQLLGGDGERNQTRDEVWATRFYEEAFGTLRVKLPFGAREYPISESERSRVMGSLNDQGHSWLSFASLDNRLALINPAFVRSLDLITDYFEVMPTSAAPDVYKALTDAESTEDALDAASPEVRKEMELLIQLLPEAVADPDDTEQGDADKVSLAMHYTRVLWRDGSTSHWLMSDDDAQCFDAIEDQGPRGFRVIHTDGAGIHRFINAGEAVVIEAPLQLYIDLRARAATNT